MPKKQSSAKTASLFDIRFQYLDHDVLVLKGNEHDAASALLAGKIVLSLNEPLNIKRLSLRLYSTLRLNWTDHFQTPKGTFPKPNRFDKTVYEYFWDSKTLSQYLSTLQEQLGGPSSTSLSRNHSSASLKNLGHSLRSKSSSNLSHLSSFSLSSSHSNLAHNDSSTSLSASKTSAQNTVLAPGNYEVPFSAILPGNMPESIEGLPGASLVYRLEATIDRGKFHNNMVAKKHLRVIRTLTTDSVELSETVAVDNTWPNKVEYSLNVPSKAIAIGSGTPISFMLVPLLKGLKLGKIKIQLVEFYTYIGYIGPPHNGERVVCEKAIAEPDESDPNFQMDKWEVDTFLRLPASLSKCTQDCDVAQHVKVRHKIKFTIGLVNPDGHVSELRASLPIQLFISPFVTISAKYEDDTDAASLEDKTKHETENNQDEELLFSTDMHSTSNTSLSQLAEQQANSGELRRSNNGSVSSFSGLMAPPLYEKHIYDRLWSDVSPIESPISSGTATPRNNIYSNNRSDVLQHFSMSPIDTNQLTENLRQLSLQRQAQESAEQLTPNGISIPSTPRGISGDRPVFNLDGEAASTAPEATQGDYLTRGRPVMSSSYSGQAPSYFTQHHSQNGTSFNNGLMSPGLQTPPHHLSRVNSELNSSKLSQVPSYSQAIRSEPDDTLSPAYEPPLPGSNVNLAELNRRFEEMHNQSSSAPTSSKNKLLSRGSSSLSLRNLGSSRNSSNGSSPSHSRNVSSTNLANLSRTSSKRSVSGSKSSSTSNSNSNSTTNLVGSPPGNKTRFDSLVEEEETLMESRRRPARYKDQVGPDGSIEMKPVIPSLFDIAGELDSHLSSIKQQVNELNSMYKKLIIVSKSDKKELERRIEDLNYNILKTFEQCYVLIKKYEYLGKNHQKLKLDYTENDLEILSSFKKNYATKIQDNSLIFRNLQNNYIKFLRDDEDEMDTLLGNSSTIDTTLLEEEEGKTSQIEDYSKQVLQQTQVSSDSNLLRQREKEISNLAMGILEISTIFKEMESLIIDQGTLLDRIDYNLQNTVQDLKQSDKELVKAQGYQKRTTKCKIIFLLCLVVFALFILVLVKPHGTTKVIEKPAPAESRPSLEKPQEEIQEHGSEIDLL
ncbi:uncharacterized protein CANTADRAFT_7568 [Suhomyces tanzawaensis NRRL Y-17324]|uniref:t-SNARE coiled-coil homology domain-containing protein n=1 Tax=Suhomyces tanzawaensis NRRL Y-17324 TaxID=984487 RepID=A0A1E4SF14_9ASCO|nr:uncharacterized protein CANTADRAFT_7568 [Suhomyces tanzawaensis NRRL Y-17324]ODV78111.1 hypothetical protein CANTADRAFT_7568 [Suhomyces tanzawaensis NRRL Y-17324]